MRLSSRFSLLFAVLALCAAAALMTVWGNLLDRASMERAVSRLKAEDEFLAEIAAPLYSRPAELDAFVRASARALGARVTAIDESGRVLSDSDVAPERVPAMENHASRPEVRQAVSSGSGESLRFSATLDLDLLYLARRVVFAGRPVGILRIAYPLELFHAEESATLWWGRAAIAASCSLLFLVGHIASRRMAAPLRRVTAAALAVAGGDLKRDPPEEDEQEAAELSRAVRRMKASLLASLDSAEGERRLSSAVFDRLPSGLVVVGERGEIVQANPAFVRMLDFAGPAGRPLIDIVREPAIHRLFEGVACAGNEETLVWERPGEETWEVTVLALPRGTRGRTLGLFRDVSVLQRTEAMRRRFVSDVSHELRTPVASISAASETLASGGLEREEQDELLSLVARQTGRLTELIEDLTDLSRIESGSIELSRDSVCLLALAREVVADLKPRCEKAEVAVELGGDEGATVTGDRGRLSQILHNLLDNAIKFSLPGKVVRVSVSRGATGVVLSVADEGPGIPVSEREKVFQRFYQVDPSRSKAKPGTGLGLAIVKHLAMLHQATVEVGGEVGKGTTFRVIFPPPGLEIPAG